MMQGQEKYTQYSMVLIVGGLTRQSGLTFTASPLMTFAYVKYIYVSHY